MKLHENPEHWVQVVENALEQAYRKCDKLWAKVHSYYEKLYLNPDSPYKESLRLYAYKAPEGSTEMKLYIAVLDEVPDFIVPTLVAHSVVWANDALLNEPEYLDWKNNSFKKCVVRVSQKEFDKISQLPKVILGHENKTLGGRKCCAVVCPSQEIPNVLKFSKLWSPKKVTRYEVSPLVGDNESLDIIYGDYRFSIEISKIENDQLPEFDLMLYKGAESVQMAVNCWGEHLTHAEPVSDDLQHIRLSHQIVIPFGDREQQ